MIHESKRVKLFASLIRNNLLKTTWRKEYAIESGLETYGDAISIPLIAKVTEFEIKEEEFRALEVEYKTHIENIEKYISSLKHTYCECGDEFTNVSESHYMIIENGKCVNCRCADESPLEIRDGFLDGLYESRKLTTEQS